MPASSTRSTPSASGTSTTSRPTAFSTCTGTSPRSRWCSKASSSMARRTCTSVPSPHFCDSRVVVITDSLDGRLTQVSMLAVFVVATVFVTRLSWRIRGLVRGNVPVSRLELWAVGGYVFLIATGSCDAVPCQPRRPCTTRPNCGARPSALAAYDAVPRRPARTVANDGSSSPGSGAPPPSSRARLSAPVPSWHSGSSSPPSCSGASRAGTSANRRAGWQRRSGWGRPR